MARTLAHYQIREKLGAGGMGEVYRATDAKLGRDVAIKLLPEAFSQDADRMARFTREAQVLASLNHPNIAAIYGVEERALVMELVEGKTLSGPLPPETALNYARQIADAIEAAHEKGIVHRDLKPANIMITTAGVVKVLDFGLAKAAEKRSGDIQNSPTLSLSATRAGVVLGTVPYMSPEQARGKPVDHRSDIWAFGCVLYQMFTGEQPFQGESASDIVAEVLTNQPDFDRLPVQVRAVVEKCLRKDVRRRWQAIGDVRIALDETASVNAALPAVTPWRERLAWVGALAIVGALLFWAGGHWNKSTPAHAVRLAINLPAHIRFAQGVNMTVPAPRFAVSPNGHAIVFAAAAPQGQATLWIRALDDLTARPIAGTENAVDPFWSPDSRWVGFVSDGKLKKTPASGGPVQEVAAVGNSRGASWGPDDAILFARANSTLFRVASTGGPVTAVTKLDKSQQEGTHRWPQFLPDGRHLLYGIRSSLPSQTGIYASSLDGKVKKLLVHTESAGYYVPPGFVVYLDGDMLLGQEFDAVRLELKGQPFAIVEGVGHASTGFGAFSASMNGVLAYAGPILRSTRLTWFDRGGKALDRVTPPGDYTDFRLSPDEKQIAGSLIDVKTGTVNIWLTDVARGSTSPFAFGYSLNASPVWSPDGTRILYRTVRKGMAELYQKSASGGGKDQPVQLDENQRAVLAQAVTSVPDHWSPDGRYLIYSVLSSNWQLWVLPLSGDARKPYKLFDSPADNTHGNFSPDGRLVAYTSNESGNWQVHVQTFPVSDRKWQISTNGGYEPRWRADGREIYYLSEDRDLMAVDVRPGPSFGIPKQLFHTRVFPGVSAQRTNYVPSRDGRSFLINIQTGEAPPNPITVVLNWTAGLKR